MDELLSRKIHTVLITVSGIQGLETKVRMVIPACISSVLLALVRAVCTLGCLQSEIGPFKELSCLFDVPKISFPSCVLPEVFIFLHDFPYPQKKTPHSKIQFLLFDDS